MAGYGGAALASEVLSESQLPDNEALWFGNDQTTDVALEADAKQTSGGEFILWMGAGLGRRFLIAPLANRGGTAISLGSVAPANPQVFIFSGTSWATAVNQFVRIFHDGTDTLISVGTGAIRFRTADNIGTATNTLRLSINDAYNATLYQATANYTLAWSDPAAARTITIPDPGGADSFVFRADTATLTNKTFSGGTFTGTIAGSHTLSGATITFTGGAIDLTAGAAFTFRTTDGFNLLLGANGANRLAIGSTIGRFIVYNTTANITVDFADPAAARTLTVPDPGGADSFVFRADTATLTNKTFSGGTFTGTIAGTPTLSGATITLSGDLAVNGSNITTTTATFNLINANATTVNFASAATTLRIGAATVITGLGLAAVAGQTLSIVGNTYTLALAAGTTNTLWVGYLADGTTAAAGIAFGVSRDVTLFRNTATTLRISGQLSVVRDGSLNINIQTYNTSADGAILDCYHARGTEASPTATASADDFMRLLGRAYGTSFAIGCEISFRATQAWTGTAHGCEIRFNNTANGATTNSLRLIITQGGVITTGTAAPTNVTAAGAGVFLGGIAFTDVANAWIDDASQGTGTTTHYIGNQSINTTSDVRLKKDILTSQIDAMAIFRQLRVVDYAWDDPSDTAVVNRNSRGRFVGMLAQETVDLVPWIINAPDRTCWACRAGLRCEKHPSPWFVEYEHMAGLFVKGFQQVDSRLSELESLKARVAVLEAELAGRN